MPDIQELRRQLAEAEAQEKANQLSNAFESIRSQYEGKSFVDKRIQVYGKNTHEVLAFVSFGKFKMRQYGERHFVDYTVDEVVSSPTTGFIGEGVTLRHNGRKKNSFDISDQRERRLLDPGAREITPAKFKQVRKAVDVICQGVHSQLLDELSTEGTGDWPEAHQICEPPDVPHLVVPFGRMSCLVPDSVFTFQNGKEKIYYLTPRSRAELIDKLNKEEASLRRCASLIQACDVRYYRETEMAIDQLREMLRNS